MMTKSGHKNIMQQRRREDDKGPYRHFLLFSLAALTMPMSAPRPAKIAMLCTDIGVGRGDAGG